MTPQTRTDFPDYLAIEAEARALRAQYIANGMSRLWAALSAALHPGRRHTA